MFAYWRRAEDPQAGGPDWLAIAIFFVIACAWSWAAARWGAVRLPGGKAAPIIDGTVLIGFGPVMGALIADVLRPMQRAGRAGFLGKSRLWALVALAAPPACLAATGIGVFHVNPHLDAFTIGLSMIVYCIGEELGWREWLYNALGGIALWRGALVTWLLCFAWHWTFLWPSLIVPSAAAIFAGVLLVGSFALAAATRRTRSSAIAAGWHTAAKALGSPAQIPMIILLLLATWLAGDWGVPRALRFGRKGE
ncbi:hypothetical protein FHS31_001995 [Sphingomonas vulcanisoli]|uniref:CAAX prenyl protease 2/Lysostaphin resistance protein A-like domain-containing protein n=1 Tax=Sphingomonas vulcanisoli TaxID=1658060 RepID=A0ABX0TS81_9SPHN|nr:CPBP family glutamic-type intramembrane protease [Sphingomonas vulcanisoli]NIJ08378.1 hypothetical protein [Sphingomonas vulcanisoli]